MTCADSAGSLHHGNPLSARGSLVFTDFGWDLLGMLRGSGFDDAWAELWLAPEMGHAGTPQIVFRAITPAVTGNDGGSSE